MDPNQHGLKMIDNNAKQAYLPVAMRAFELCIEQELTKYTVKSGTVRHGSTVQLVPYRTLPNNYRVK